jgi:hypothetical protein
MSVPKFLTLEELIRDHERLCAEVEELKKQFESHSHVFNSTPVLPVSAFNEVCMVCGVDTTRADTSCCHFSASGKVMPGHLNVKQ